VFEEAEAELYQAWAWDDVKDVALNLEKVRQARKLEMGFIKSRKVYKYAKKDEVQKRGFRVIGTKWVDTNKGDDKVEKRSQSRRWSDEEEEMQLEINNVEEAEAELYQTWAWDDVKDVALNLEKVRQARKLEMGFIRSRKVYKYAKRDEVQKRGFKVIGTKWVDTNKGDDKVENYRSRLVAQEFKIKAEGALFAATPPLETLRTLLTIFVTSRFDDKGKRRPTEGENRMGMMLIDIKRAHFYAPAQREIFVQLPPEDPRSGEENICGELQQSMYGTRDASSNWEKEYCRALS
jgi:hypothetical protein